MSTLILVSPGGKYTEEIGFKDLTLFHKSLGELSYSIVYSKEHALHSLNQFLHQEHDNALTKQQDSLELNIGYTGHGLSTREDVVVDGIHGLPFSTTLRRDGLVFGGYSTVTWNDFIEIFQYTTLKITINLYVEACYSFGWNEKVKLFNKTNNRIKVKYHCTTRIGIDEKSSFDSNGSASLKTWSWEDVVE